MTWLVIGLLFLAAFGPILWLLPNERDKRLAKLRMEARRRGLGVELTRMTDPRPALRDRVSSGGVVKKPIIKCAAYRMLVPRPLEHIQPWRVESGEAHTSDELVDCSDSLPVDWLAVEVDRNGACLYWREEVSEATMGEALDGIVSLLGDLLEKAREADRKHIKHQAKE